MTDVISHRGPDDDGHHLDAGVALGMRRLSVIDPAHSPQPIFNEDRSVCTVFNGEIYNFRELRASLRGRGHSFTTNGDTETIVHLYEEYGDRFPQHLNGMFGIAVWDSARRRLVLARDRMGVKPLYYAQGKFGLVFGSELKSILASGLVEPALEPMAAELFLAYGHVPAPWTLFKGIRKLLPATVLVWEDGRYAGEHAYWTPWDNPPKRAGTSWADDQEQLIELLRLSVRRRLVADVPLGVMLSGGLDSSLITALMVEEVSEPVKTFSIGFREDAAANELPEARRVAERLGTDHTELTTSALDHPTLLDEALWHVEEPIADISQLGFLLLSRLARKTVTVALSGQGADELLGGYRKHQVAAAAALLARGPKVVRKGVKHASRLADPRSTAARGLIALGTDDPVERMLAMSRVIQAGEREQLLAPEFLQPGAEAEIQAVVRRHLVDRDMSPLGETLYLDTRLALVDNMLLYFDKTSMATSLEVRVPFLDPDLVSFCTGLPDSRRVWRLRRKDLLKRASRGLVDDAIIDKKKRGFFHAALGAWLRAHRAELLEDTLLDERSRARGQIRTGAVEALVAGTGESGKKADQALVSLLLLEKWQRMWVDPGSEGQRLYAASLAAGHEASQPRLRLAEG